MMNVNKQDLYNQVAVRHKPYWVWNVRVCFANTLQS